MFNPGSLFRNFAAKQAERNILQRIKTRTICIASFLVATNITRSRTWFYFSQRCRNIVSRIWTVVQCKTLRTSCFATLQHIAFSRCVKTRTKHCRYFFSRLYAQNFQRYYVTKVICDVIYAKCYPGNKRARELFWFQRSPEYFSLCLEPLLKTINTSLQTFLTDNVSHQCLGFFFFFFFLFLSPLRNRKIWTISVIFQMMYSIWNQPYMNCA